ncbi:FHIPEP family type III secretion protein, partial [Acinetobacter variabilis]|uniref:FHIPEP family type III secretion protein n=1 Tax=Acinetobacter variabilis TaxID=70346 RepID=UPI0030F9B0A8
MALLVTRASRKQDMGGAVNGQVFGQHKALTIAASILLVVGLVPGMPNLAFLSLAATVGYAAWAMRKRSLAAEREAAQPDAGQPSPEQAASAELGWDDLRPVDPLGLEV